MNISISEFLTKHNAQYDEELNTLTISVICDSTAVFLTELICVLGALGFQDIEYAGYPITKDIPVDKPWLNWKYVVRGVLPNDMIYNNGNLYVKRNGDKCVPSYNICNDVFNLDTTAITPSMIGHYFMDATFNPNM